MRRILSICALALHILCSDVIAQEQLQLGDSGGLFVGLGSIDVNELQEFLPTDFPDLRSELTMFGIRGYMVYNRFLFGLRGQILIGREISQDSLSASVCGATGFITLGYQLVSSADIGVSPMIGIGSGSMLLALEWNDGLVTRDLDYRNPEDQTDFSTGSLMFDVSTTFELRLQKNQRDENTEGITLGLTVGYQFGLESNEWTAHGFTTDRNPDFAITIYYATLSIGYSTVGLTSN